MASQPQGGKTVLDVQTWEQTFQELMQQEKPRARWTLKLDEKLEPDCLAAGWMQYQQKGFGRKNFPHEDVTQKRELKLRGVDLLKVTKLVRGRAEVWIRLSDFEGKSA
ncbi:receptor-transporting protein 4 isoform X3 [Callorhinus ursinus]|uniref:receptor-transporting protein 4 isoform X3 n=1 Tax=Callorhinus ursinus TaxID=34884 RepID=UPI003CCFF624